MNDFEELLIDQLRTPYVLLQGENYVVITRDFKIELIEDFYFISDINNTQSFKMKVHYQHYEDLWLIVDSIIKDFIAQQESTLIRYHERMRKLRLRGQDKDNA